MSRRKPGSPARPIAERLWENALADGTGCWLWQLYKSPDGYGRMMRSDGGTVLVHRIAYEITTGPIPEGLEIDHLCFIRHCIQPRHLEVVTPEENKARGRSYTHWIEARAGRSVCARGLHPWIESNIYYRPDRVNSPRCRACERERSQRRRRTTEGRMQF